MVPCLHQDNIYIKRKLRVWRAQKCISLVGAKSPLTCAGRQSTVCQGRQDRVGNGNLRKLGWTYRHGYGGPEMYFPSRVLTCVGRQPRQYLHQKEGRQYRVGNGNLRKLGWKAIFTIGYGEPRNVFP